MNLPTPTGPQATVDPAQLQAELQRAFDVHSKEIEDLKSLTVAYIDMHKAIFRAFIDLDIIQSQSVIDVLKGIRDSQDDGVGRVMMDGLVSSLGQYVEQVDEGHPKTSDSHLRLVQKPVTSQNPED